MDCKFDVNVILDSKNLKHVWHCVDCNSINTPQQRNNRCNACGILYSKQRFCYYCDYTYRISIEKNELLKCSKCEKCVHIECEKEFKEGYIRNQDQLYFCHNCHEMKF